MLPLEAASLAAADLASRAALLDRTQEQARARLQQSQEALANADARGASRSAVTAAASMLDALPDRARSLFDDADELRAEGDRVEQESRRLQAADADAALQLADVERLEAAAGHARTAAQAVASASAALRESVAGVLTAADAVSAVAQAEYELTTAVAGLADNLVGLRVAAADSARLAQNAADETAVLRRTSAAATAAAGLHPGDDCSVCARRLPADWHAPDSATDTALAAAAQTEDQLRTQASKAAGTVNAVEHLLKQRGGDLQTGQNRHQLAWSTLNRLLTDLANSPELVLLARPTNVADAAPLDETALLAGVNTAARSSQPHPPTASVGPQLWRSCVGRRPDCPAATPQPRSPRTMPRSPHVANTLRRCERRPRHGSRWSETPPALFRAAPDAGRRRAVAGS